VLVTASGDVCRAYYSKNSGGITEDSEVVWGRHAGGLRARYDGPLDAPDARFFPVTERNVREYVNGSWLKNTRLYAGPNLVSGDLVSRFLGAVDDGTSGFRWQATVTQDELRKSVGDSTGISDLDTVQDIRAEKRGRSGRLAEVVLTYTTKIGNRVERRIGPEYKIRKTLGTSFLRSSAIAIDLTKDRRGNITKATFTGAGWGHGVGLCQVGGLGRALSGQNHMQILAAYYDQVRLGRMYA
jgi:SpoIID/LytB domain protein